MQPRALTQERVACWQVGIDGEVVWGEALVSSEHITGEALPVRRRKGSLLPAGALDHDGVLVVRSTCLADDSTPARIARLTSTAQVLPTFIAMHRAAGAVLLAGGWWVSLRGAQHRVA